jgi:hypothetical protein
MVCIAIGFAAVGCQAVNDPSSVEYGAAQPIGRWGADGVAGAPAAGTGTPGLTTPPVGIVWAPAGSDGRSGTAGVGRSGTAGVGSVISAGSGAGGMLALGGRSASAGVGAAGSGGSTAGNGTAGAGAGAAGASAGSLTTLAFDVTTSPVGGRYQPRNIGAIWVTDGTGKLVKSLEVWAAARRRYLTGYASALAGSLVDVTASATLSSHRTHHATWNMKDRNGAAAAPGKYKLFMETTDGDMTGRSSSVDFDTSAGPQTLTPPDVASFSSMKLQLQ